MSNIYALLSLAVAMVIVGSSVVAGKLMVTAMPIHLASAIRFALATLLLLPLLWLKEGGLPHLSRRSWLLLAGQSLCGSFLFTLFLLHGLKLTSPASAGIITATTPACMGIVAWVFLRTPPGKRGLGGILLSVIGVAAINLASAAPGQAANTAELLTGNLLVLCAVVFESIFLILRKAVREPLTPLAASTIISLFGLLWFLPTGVYELATTDLGTVSMVGWWTVFYYGAVVTVLAYLFWFAGVTRVSSSTAGVFSALMPVSALLLSALILGTPLTIAQLAGCGFVLGGILLIATR